MIARHSVCPSHDVAAGNPKAASGGGEAAVTAPEGCAGQKRRSQQVNVEPSETGTHQAVVLDEREPLIVLDNRRLGKAAQEHQDLCTVAEVPTGELTDDERVAFHLTVVQKLCQGRIATPKVVDPHRGIDEHQRPTGEELRGRRLGIERKPGWEPPRAAKRRAVSRAISARSPA